MSEPPRDKLLGHEYDGIREYDNKLPNWWQYILYGSIVFAVLYRVLFHTFGVMPLSHEQYRDEMAAAAEAQLARMAGQEVTDHTLELMANVPERVAAGKAIFDQFCVECHRPDGSGGVGPNLTDAYWLHGGSALDILRTVTDGVPEKGMVAWGSQLGPRRVEAVVAYVLTLRGKGLPGKEPQGELWKPATQAGAGAPGTASDASLPAPARPQDPGAVPAAAGAGESR